VLIPGVLGALSVQILPRLKSGAIGLSLGMSGSLLVYGFTAPGLKWIDSPTTAMVFLVSNSVLCWVLARYLALPWPEFIQGMVQPWQLSHWQTRWQTRWQSQRQSQRRPAFRPIGPFQNAKNAKWL
jgi:hypothetical protein